MKYPLLLFMLFLLIEQFLNARTNNTLLKTEYPLDCNLINDGKKSLIKISNIDSSYFPKNEYYFKITPGLNYSFKNSEKVGYSFESACIIQGRHFYRPPFILYIFGIRYSMENQYYQLPQVNPTTLRPEIENTKSHYLSIPFSILRYVFRTQGKIYYKLRKLHFSTGMGLTPEYLIKSKNLNGKLTDTDFNRFNLSGTVSVGIRISNQYNPQKLNLRLAYSKDFFENLKNRNIYNQVGDIVGKQKSKTDLFTISLTYLIPKIK